LFLQFEKTLIDRELNKSFCGFCNSFLKKDNNSSTVNRNPIKEHSISNEDDDNDDLDYGRNIRLTEKNNADDWRTQRLTQLDCDGDDIITISDDSQKVVLQKSKITSSIPVVDIVQPIVNNSNLLVAKNFNNSSQNPFIASGLWGCGFMIEILLYFFYNMIIDHLVYF